MHGFTQRLGDTALLLEELLLRGVHSLLVEMCNFVLSIFNFLVSTTLTGSEFRQRLVFGLSVIGRISECSVHFLLLRYVGL